MRPTRRENNIFNVSAIDLFASALGAFMIVSFVLLPYFPNTGEVPPAPTAPTTPPAPAPEPEPPPGISAEAAEALEDQISELQEQLDGAQSREGDLARALEDATSTVKKFPPLDLVIALDTTGSMMYEVASLREEIAGLAELLVELTEDAAVGIIDFKDRCDPRTAIRIAPLRPVTRRTVRELTAFARSMSPGGSYCNDTDPEDYATALRAAARSAWRPSSERRSIVLISDNPAYLDVRAQAISDAAEFARRPGARHTVSSVYVETGTALRDTTAFMQQVARAGGGRFLQANQNASLSVTILLAVFRS